MTSRITMKVRKAQRPPSFWAYMKQDWAGEPFLQTLLFLLLGFGPFRAMLIYRISHILHRRGVRVVPGFLRSINLSLHGCDISPEAVFGGGMRLAHTTGVVIGRGTRAGRGCVVFQNVTIGGGSRTIGDRTHPHLGDDVWVYAGAVVVGAIDLGDHSRVGANAFVNKDVPAYAVVGGVPARILKYVDPESVGSESLVLPLSAGYGG